MQLIETAAELALRKGEAPESLKGKRGQGKRVKKADEDDDLYDSE